jgi:hypothetical protein
LSRAMPPRKQGVGWSCRRGRHHFGPSGCGILRELLEGSSRSATCKGTGQSFCMIPSDGHRGRTFRTAVTDGRNGVSPEDLAITSDGHGGRTQSWLVPDANLRTAVTDGSNGESPGDLAATECLRSVLGVRLAGRRGRWSIFQGRLDLELRAEPRAVPLHRFAGCRR